MNICDRRPLSGVNSTGAALLVGQSDHRLRGEHSSNERVVPFLFFREFSYMKRFAKFAGVTATALALTLFAAAEDAPRTTTANSDLVAVNAQLQHGLNAQTAKQGDTVTAKLLQTVHLNGTELPRNTILIGHIDEAQSSQ